MGATFAQGTLLQRRTTVGVAPTPDAYTTIASVHSITGPSMTGDAVDVSNQDTASGFREYIAGLRTGGQVTFDISYAPADNTHDASSTGLIGDLKDGSEEQWRLVLSGTDFPSLKGAIVDATGSPEVIEVPLLLGISLRDGQTVHIEGAAGAWGTEMNGRTFIIDEPDTVNFTFELSGFNPSATWTSGGTVAIWPNFVFQGFVSGFEVTAPVDGPLTAAVTITATGDVTAPITI